MCSTGFPSLLAREERWRSSRPAGSECTLTSQPLQLFVDGREGNSQSKITMTRDWPPSGVSIYHVPIDIKAGRHQAEIRFRQNESGAHRWCFTVGSNGR